MFIIALFLEQVEQFVQLTELYYAGSHGMDIVGPAKSSDGFRVKGTKARDKKGNDLVAFQPASEYLPLINEVFFSLKIFRMKYLLSLVD
jgi:trehalose 6-phosphate phosphatase